MDRHNDYPLQREDILSVLVQINCVFNKTVTEFVGNSNAFLKMLPDASLPIKSDIKSLACQAFEVQQIMDAMQACVEDTPPGFIFHKESVESRSFEQKMRVFLRANAALVGKISVVYAGIKAYADNLLKVLPSICVANTTCH